MTETFDHAADLSLESLRRFLDHSPSSYHAAQRAVDRLAAAGFRPLTEAGTWDPIPERGYLQRDGAVIAWKTPPRTTPASGFRLVGAHTDSPGLRVKPNPERTVARWRQLSVEVYGGPLLNSWLDRDLGIAGRVVHRDGTTELVAVHAAVARIPQLAIHLDRGVNDGLRLDQHQHLTPVWGTDTGIPPRFDGWLAELTGCSSAPVAWDLALFDIQPAAILGADQSLLASGRLDNLVSCWGAVEALARCEPEATTAVIVLNDHEEVGSNSITGAAGPMLERFLERHVLAHGGQRSDFLRACAASMAISADNAHAIHPNYPERHHADHAPVVNAGPAIKINSNQRYATTARGTAYALGACDAAEIPSQTFVSRNTMPCGSTIGPVTATRLGIETIDVGVPQLSMHSARELCGVDDPLHLARLLDVHLSGDTPLSA